MHTKKECLQLIDSILKVAEDPSSAYLLRTRIKRMLLSTSRLAAHYAGVEPPTLPRNVTLPNEASPQSHNIIESCNNLLVETKKLCQPSEALDTRWEKGWAVVIDELKGLQRQLVDWSECLDANKS